MKVTRGIVYYAISQVCLVLDMLAVHHLGPLGLDVDQMTLLRGIGSAAIAGLLIPKYGYRIVQTQQPRMQLLRGLLTLVSLWLIFYSLSNLPLADASALNQTRPIWMALMGVIFLGEVISRPRIVAVVIVLFGTMAIISPAFSSWNIVYLVAVAGAIINSSTIVVNRHLTRRDPPATTMAFFAIVLLVGSIPAAFKPLPWEHWPELVIISAVGALATWFSLLAASHAEVSLLAVYDNLRLPILIILGFALFAERPSLATIVGSVLIILPGVVLFRMERRANEAKLASGPSSRL